MCYYVRLVLQKNSFILFAHVRRVRKLRRHGRSKVHKKGKVARIKRFRFRYEEGGGKELV